MALLKRGLLALFVCLFTVSALAAPQHFAEAKKELRDHVYNDRNLVGDAYCQCTWDWTGRTGGRVHLRECGYQVRAQANRAARIEWEHIVPASNFGRQRQCWQNGGRRNCVSEDPLFRVMEADMHNLTPVVGEVNGDRSNYNFGPVRNVAAQYGACDFKVDFKHRTAQPPPALRGQVARVYFYMADRYDLRLSKQQQRLLMAWDRGHPVSAWERQRDRRIAAIMGHSNPFVTGERSWTLNHRNSREGLVSVVADASRTPASTESTRSAGPIHGNRNSKVYHLPQGCPSYNAMKPSNRVNFDSEAAARAAGYRKAGNCR
ncbi:deoxyribonuclease-1 [Alloalcanivorax xenomutans]|uniref:endonuclease n=1 Tax=Alloalcanivorax xenomutans TaxID=1094342 RepID=UPI000BCC4BD6|nr:endonuclease [Alloalcanivorax xenomutans]SOC14593.1 deoxyribonuclease-1 [Alloalcanivorax xenomutans]